MAVLIDSTVICMTIATATGQDTRSVRLCSGHCGTLGHSIESTGEALWNAIGLMSDVLSLLLFWPCIHPQQRLHLRLQRGAILERYGQRFERLRKVRLALPGSAATAAHHGDFHSAGSAAITRTPNRQRQEIDAAVSTWRQSDKKCHFAQRSDKKCHRASVWRHAGAVGTG